MKNNSIDHLDTWDKTRFVENLTEYLEQRNGAAIDRHLIAIYAIEMDHWIACARHVREFGPIETFNSGTTTGASTHCNMMIKSAQIILRLRKALNLGPRGKPENGKPISPELAALLKGP